MDYLAIHDQAMAECNNMASEDAVYIGAVLFQLLTKQPCRMKEPKVSELFPKGKLLEVCASLKGSRATASEVYKMVKGEDPSISNATIMANQLRMLGYVMLRSNGRNYYYF